MYRSKHATTLFCLASALLLSSCGGSSSDESEEVAENKSVQVSKAEFDTMMDSEGTWLATFDLLTSFRSEFESAKHSGDVSVDLTAFAIAPFYLRVQEDNTLTKGQCSLSGPIELPNSTFENDFNEEFLVEQLEGKLNLRLDTTFCAGDLDITEQYFKSSDDDYAVEYYCGEEKVGGLHLERISQEPAFSKAALRFTSDTYPDLADADSASSGCGNLLDFDVVARIDNTGADEPQSFGFDMAAVSIVSAYQDSSIAFDFLFSSMLTMGEHEVGALAEVILDQDSSKVAITVTSSEFGGTSSFPMHMAANNGTVTVTEITDKAASGTYNFTTDSGANFVGSFSFDYE